MRVKFTSLPVNLNSVKAMTGEVTELIIHETEIKHTSHFIHSLFKYLWNAFYVPDTLLGTWDTLVKKQIKISAFKDLIFLFSIRGRQTVYHKKNKQTI